MKITIALVAVLAAAPLMAQGSHYVRGHFRSDGTYVAPHHRTNPDRRTSNNWSTAPNVNPYTGKQGTVNPYRQPQSRSNYGSPSHKNPYGR